MDAFCLEIASHIFVGKVTFLRLPDPPRVADVEPLVEFRRIFLSLPQTANHHTAGALGLQLERLPGRARDQHSRFQTFCMKIRG